MAFVSFKLPLVLYICPEVLIIAGIEASIIISEGTCKLVIPLSEFTIANSGPLSKAY